MVGVVANASTTQVGNLEPLEFYMPQSRDDALDSVLLLRVSPALPALSYGVFETPQALSTGVCNRRCR